MSLLVRVLALRPSHHRTITHLRTSRIPGGLSVNIQSTPTDHFLKQENIGTHIVWLHWSASQFKNTCFRHTGSKSFKDLSGFKNWYLFSKFDGKKTCREIVKILFHHNNLTSEMCWLHFGYTIYWINKQKNKTVTKKLLQFDIAPNLHKQI